jgi:hypothetical protein
MSEIGRFRHLRAFNSLAYEVYHVNERIMTGDYARAKFALPVVERLIKEYSEYLAKDGATQIDIKPYIAAGDAIGLCWSYNIDDCQLQGSFVPRRPAE